jgi:hypothetical protein
MNLFALNFLLNQSKYDEKIQNQTLIKTNRKGQYEKKDRS